MSRTVCLFVFVCVIAGNLANPASQLPCLGEVTQCEVSNVQITPCTKQERCLFKIGKNASISFDFTPAFDATELETEVSTLVSGVKQNFPGLDRDGCKSTACPVSAGKKQNFSHNLQLRRAEVAKGSYDIKWELWNKAQREQMCCFITRIRLQ
ncbi:MD-2-related lipid-recognition protein-like [Cydia splendana]|uniref:MD-2-related lipid-recognition protein-like n=1 Tax=Cydia splendana TaxID=1100963 RepID=UPI00212BFE36